ncbi:hypothetical protein [Leifsonia shinshuensis]
MSDHPGAGERVRLRWGWILVCTLLGLVLLALAAYGEAKKWDDVVTGTLVNIGSALLFSFVLFFFENRFTRRVVSKVQAVTDAAEQRITAQAAEVTTRIDDLAATVAASAASRRAAATEHVDSLGENLTAMSLSVALETAREQGVITENGLAVPGYKGAQNVAVAFTQDSRSYSSANGPVTNFFGVIVAIRVDSPHPQSVFDEVPAMEWEPNIDAATLTDRLTTALRQQQKHDEARRLDWTYVFRTLVRGLQLAHTVAGPNPSLGGALLEMVTDDWVITTAGVEQISTGRRLSFDDVVPVHPVGRPAFETNTPATPEGLDGTTWETVRRRARPYRHYAR